MSSSRKRSEIWLHFTEIGDDKATCDLCKRELSFKGGAITNLKRHLNKRHPTVTVESFSASKKPAIRSIVAARQIQDKSSERTATVTSPTSFDYLDPNAPSYSEPQRQAEENPGPSQEIEIDVQITSDPLALNQGLEQTTVSKQRRINMYLLKFIVSDFRPFSIVGDRGFVEYTKALDPTYQLPSRSMLTKSLLPQAYEACLENVKNYLNGVEKISITTDIRTFINNNRYTVFTAHFITDTEDWQVGSVLLDCVDISSSRHTSEYLKENIRNCLLNFAVDKKVNVIVTDSAPNIAIAVKLAGYEHLSCFTDSLNLIVLEGIAVIEAIHKKVKAIVEHFNRSPRATEKLHQLQTQICETTVPLKLINDVETTWNSTLYMFERFCDLQQATEDAVDFLYIPLEMPTTIEMDTLKELCVILKPFDNLQMELSAAKNVTVSKITVALEGLREYLRTIRSTTTTPSGVILIDLLLAKIDIRFQNVDRNCFLQLATYLDPRFKSQTMTESIKTQIKDRITRLVVEMIQKEQKGIPVESQSDLDADNPIWCHFDDQCPPMIVSNPNSQALIEIRQYNDENLLPRKEDPLIWWKCRQLIYPRLSRLAKWFLGIPASSVPSEGIFSNTGLILNERRNRLKPKTQQKLIFLNANINFM